MIYPKSLEENLKFRYSLIAHCQEDEISACEVREIFARDILFAFNVFFWTFDPRTKEKDLPFITYDFQDEAILAINNAIEKQEDLFIDKSRDMGVSWMVLCVFYWRWLTKKSQQFRLGSRKEEYVDKPGDMDTLFEKLRYLLDKTPDFIKPYGFDMKKHSSYMRLVNPQNKSAMIGEATNRDFARSGRQTAVLFDEFPVWETAEEAWIAASDATKCKIPVGTPKGSGNKFAELSRTNEIKNKLHLIWWKHPKKAYTPEFYREKMSLEMHNDQSGAPRGCFVDVNGKIRSFWYDQECERRAEKDIRENLDCDYISSGNPYFDTRTCDYNLRTMAKAPIDVGNLNWIVSPVFDENGTCINQDKLKVEFIPNRNGLLKVWEHPVKDPWEDAYVIPADVAEGLEQGDFSDAWVLKRTVQTDGDLPVGVAEIHGHLRDFEFAEELAKLAVYYQRAYVAPERNKNGTAVILQLIRIYPKIWHKDVITKGYPQITDKIGFDTANHHVKKAVCDELSRAIFKKSFIDPDEYFWKETLTFVQEDGRLEAQGKSQGQKCFDDRVMTRAIGWWVNSRMPMPHRIFPKVELPKWMQQQRRPEGSLVGWVV